MPILQQVAGVLRNLPIPLPPAFVLILPFALNEDFPELSVTALLSALLLEKKITSAAFQPHLLSTLKTHPQAHRKKKMQWELESFVF